MIMMIRVLASRYCLPKRALVQIRKRKKVSTPTQPAGSELRSLEDAKRSLGVVPHSRFPHYNETYTALFAVSKEDKEVPTI